MPQNIVLRSELLSHRREKKGYVITEQKNERPTRVGIELHNRTNKMLVFRKLCCEYIRSRVNALSHCR